MFKYFVQIFLKEKINPVIIPNSHTKTMLNIDGSG